MLKLKIDEVLKVDEDSLPIKTCQVISVTPMALTKEKYALEIVVLLNFISWLIDALQFRGRFVLHE